MNDPQLTEIVHQHAEALKDERDIGEKLLAAHPERRSALADLFDIAGRVKAAMEPIRPRENFAAQLRRQLLHEARLLKQQRRQPWVWFALGMGSMVYLFSLFAVSMRFAWWLFCLVGLVASWRKRAGMAGARQPVRNR